MKAPPPHHELHVGDCVVKVKLPKPIPGTSRARVFQIFRGQTLVDESTSWIRLCTAMGWADKPPAGVRLVGPDDGSSPDPSAAPSSAAPSSAAPPTQPCRRCSECQGVSHHWMQDFDDGPWQYSPEPRPVWACKHCDFTMLMDGDDIEGERVEELYAKRHGLAPESEPDAKPQPPVQRDLFE